MLWERCLAMAFILVTIDDMQLLPEAKFNVVLKAGKYEAVHFIDDTCDGVVVAVVGGLSGRRQNFPAYSLVAAPDFFPLADQLEVANWVRRDLKNRQEQFAQGAPWPLCEGRRPANLELPRPGAPSRKAFDRNDETVVAGLGHWPRALMLRTARSASRVSYPMPLRTSSSQAGTSPLCGTT